MIQHIYCAGLAFDPAHNRVVLIRKNRPDWQRGKLNGVGGKIGDEVIGEAPEIAMCREFMEETGVAVSGWREFHVMNGESWRVFWFTVDTPLIDQCKTVTDEEVEVISVFDAIGSDALIENLRWLIPMALDSGHTFSRSSY